MNYYRFNEEILAGWSWNLVTPKIEGEESRELSTENHMNALSHRETFLPDSVLRTFTLSLDDEFSE